MASNPGQLTNGARITSIITQSRISSMNQCQGQLEHCESQTFYLYMLVSTTLIEGTTTKKFLHKKLNKFSFGHRFKLFNDPHYGPLRKLLLDFLPVIFFSCDCENVRTCNSSSSLHAWIFNHLSGKDFIYEQFMTA